VSQLERISIESICATVPVIPVVVIERLDDAVPLAFALLAGGLNVLEVTLRTPAALSAVATIATALPAVCVGVGSVGQPEQFADALRAGARFAVSPGATAELQAAAQAQALPWLPGAQTVSEILALRNHGYRLIKILPAAAAGGTAFLRSISGPIPDVRFCPTGGITATNAAEYLRLPNVACVGGSWLASPGLVERQRWAEITLLAQQAYRLRQPQPSTAL
jgi:2-dehydro-3-deoxyphosphogluconate aldolase/(4S)-4-hydroxy-2-oxoglutarate aldolase